MSEHKNKHPGQSPKEPKDDNMPSQRFEDENPAQSSSMRDDAILPSPDDIKELHREIETLGASLKEEQEKAAMNWERLLRKEADLQNLQKRSQEEIEKTRKFAIEKFAAEILEVLDSLEHGLNFAIEGKVDAQGLLEGMKMTQSIMVNALDKQGIKVINPINEAFNPSFHEAISVQETTDVSPNQVLAVVQKGYILNGRLLRPARVVVSRAPAS